MGMLDRVNIRRKWTSVFFLGAALFFIWLSSTAVAEKRQEFEIVYHIYVDGEYIGMVDDRDLIQDVINEKLKIQRMGYPDVELVIDESVTILPEKFFLEYHPNHHVVDRLADILTVKAEAYALKVADDKIVGYFSSKTDAEQVLASYQQKYVEEDVFEALDDVYVEEAYDILLAQSDSIDLEVDESIVTTVTFSDEIEISKERISPDQILTVEEGIQLLEKGTLEEKKHKVEKGEVLGSIADNYDLTLEELLSLNPSLTEDSLIQIGQEIHVTALEPFIEVVVVQQSVEEETAHFDTEIIETDDLYKGEQKVKNKGKHGKKEVHYEVEYRNGREVKREVLIETIIEEPINEVILKGTKVIPSMGSGSLVWPTNGGYVSSQMGMRWGRMHNGIDIARPSNRTIKAADHGVVEFAGWHGGYGNKIVINHNNGMKTTYAHLSSIDVKVGQKVEKGSKIGVMGSTGHSTGVHLHFEVRVNGSIQNPMKYY